MRLLLRLRGGAGPSVDLDVEVPAGASIGELADHLSGVLGTTAGQQLEILEVGSAVTRRPGRQESVAAAGPPSGSTVRVVATPPSSSRRPVDAAPVHLVPVRRHRAATDPGTAAPGDGGGGGALRYGANSVAGARIDVGERVELVATATSAPTVNGERVWGSRRLRSGDLLGGPRTAAVVRIDGPLVPPPPRGPERPHRPTTRVPRAAATTTVELPAPPTPARLPGFPLLSAAVPLSMGVGLWVATRSVATAFFVLFSFVFVVAAGIEARREVRAEQRFRLREYRVALDDAVERIEDLHRAEAVRRDDETPPPEQVRRIAVGRTARLWERGRLGDEGPSLRVRLGSAHVVPPTHVVVPEHGRRDLRLEAERIARDAELVEMACTLDLARTGGLALVGHDERATAAARALVAQLVTWIGPDLLRVEVLAGAHRRDVWKWCDWLPHHDAGGVALTADRGAAAEAVLLVADAADELEVAERLERPGAAPPLLLWLAPGRAGLPERLRHVLEFAADTATLFRDGVALRGPTHGAERTERLRPDQLGQDEALAVGRALAPVSPRRSPVGAEGRGLARASSLSAQVPLVEVLARRELLDDPGAVLEQWRRTAGTAELGAPLGTAGNGVLHLDLRRDGPHAVVAGTTGAGKSELLRTLVSSYALHHGPDRVTFLLVDYKGGAAFGPLVSLPHTVGMITDLDPALAQRALVSLRAEVRRRESHLADHGVDALDALPEAAGLAALVVVVDEFAAMARELPEFVDGLVDVAQRGRSLGVHLVLATQRPSGVVTDSIRANAALRIALRVADEDDSRDVVEVPDAAHVPRAVPGRAVLRSGPAATTAVQFAYCGATPGSDGGMRSWPLGERTGPAPAAPDDEPVIDRLVRTIVGATALAEMQPPRRPWVDPLPELVELSALTTSSRPGVASIGLRDRPHEQRRDDLLVDLDRDGGVLVLGAGGSGRSTALTTLAHAVRRHPTEQVQVYAIAADRGLSSLQRVGVDVVATNDIERVLRLLRGLARDPGGSAGPRRLLLLDGYDALEEAHERVNRGEALDLLARLARDGRATGVHLAVAARRRTDLPPALVAALGMRILLRPATEDDAMVLDLPPAAARRDRPAGRGHVDGEEVQLAVCVGPAGPDGASGGPSERGAAVGRLTTEIRHGDLPAPTVAEPCSTSPWSGWVIGIEGDELSAALLDLEHQHALVAGPPRSGRTTALTTLALAARQRAHELDATMHTFLLAARSDRPGGTTARADQTWTATADDEASWAAVLDRVDASLEADTPVLLALDDLPELLDRPSGPELERRLTDLLERARREPVRVVLSGEIDALARCYSEPLTRVRAGRTGVLLRPDPDLHGSLLHQHLPQRAELPTAAGRGWLVGATGAVPVQLARP